MISSEGLREEGFKKLREQMKVNHPAEPARFGIPQGKLDEFLVAHGFQMKELVGTEQMAARFLTLLDGSRIGHVPKVFNLIIAQAA